MIKNLDDLLEQVRSKEKKTIAVAAAEHKEILEVVSEATKEGLADFILVGDEGKIKSIMAEENLQSDVTIIDEPDHAKASAQAVQLVVDKQAGAVMKGMLHTGTFLKAVLNKEKGLNSGRQVSQISVFNKPFGSGLQLLTDCAMAIEPTLDDKKAIIENAAELGRKIGYDTPKVALLSALEVVNPKINDTMEAAVLSKMNDRGQIKGCVVDGPFALDNAISEEAAEQKGVKGPVAGKADVLVVPNLQVGNVLTKSLTYYAQMDVCAAVMGAKAPIVMTSRTDSVRNKLLSIALAAYISE